MKQRGKWLTQAQAQLATGKPMSLFRAKVMPKLKMKNIPGKKKPLYFLTEEYFTEVYKKNNTEDLIELDEDDINDENMINDILGDITGSTNNVQIDPENVDLNEARRQEIIVRTKYLEQKIDKKKNELFEEWSERFFQIFSKNFAKFKNSLIELRLEEKQLKKLNENLDLALENMEIGLTEILKEYMNDDGSLE